MLGESRVWSTPHLPILPAAWRSRTSSPLTRTIQDRQGIDSLHNVEPCQENQAERPEPETSQGLPMQCWIAKTNPNIVGRLGNRRAKHPHQSLEFLNYGYISLQSNVTLQFASSVSSLPQRMVAYPFPRELHTSSKCLSLRPIKSWIGLQGLEAAAALALPLAVVSLASAAASIHWRPAVVWQQWSKGPSTVLA